MTTPPPIRALRQLLAGVVLLIAATLLAGTGQARTLRQVIPFGPTSLDPVYSTTDGDASLQVNLFEGLVRYGADGQVQPAQAQRWTVSADGLAWTFRLREALRWNDGKPLTSADFLASFRRLASAQYRAHPKAAFLLEPIRGGREVMVGEQPLEALGIEAPDEQTLVIHLDSVTPFLPSILTHPALGPVPRHVLAQHGAAWTDPAHFVSNGPYQLDGYAHGVWLLSQNPFHHAQVRPQATRVELIERQNGNQALQELLTGKVDIVHAPPTEQLEWLKARQSIRVVSTGATLSNYLALNTADPRLADRRVRQALSMALDRREIMARLSLPLSSVAYSFAVASEAAGWQPIAPPWAGWAMEQRRERARELMRQAGYGPTRRLSLDIHMNQGQANTGLAGAARAMWNSIYVDAELASAEAGSAHYQRLAEGRYTVARAGYSSDFDDPINFLALLRSGSRKNYARWASTDYDATLDQLHQDHEHATRLACFEQLERLILEDTPIIPINHLANYFALGGRIERVVTSHAAVIAAANVRFR